METLLEKLTKYRDSDYYGFHMPGHKRSLNMLGDVRPYEIDITEIDGFDDLHHADGILLEAQQRAAQVYGSEETCFLINGSTVGILSAILGTTERKDAVLVARNCHKSVYHAIELQELRAYYLYPEFDEKTQINGKTDPEDVRQMLEMHPEIRAVVIVSPTYDGIVSDIKAIAKIVHTKGIPLIVDEAHGAHFGFHPYFPESACTMGADLVIHSLHKTLPSLTQTALLHMNGPLINRERIRKQLGMLQSSSPSYVMMAGMDSCIQMLETRRQELFCPYAERLRGLRSELKELSVLELTETEESDPSKLVISVKRSNITSKELYQCLLEKYHLQMEMVAGSYVLAMTSVGDTEEGFRRLIAALKEIDSKAEFEEDAEKHNLPVSPKAEFVCESALMSRKRYAIQNEKDDLRSVAWEEGIGLVAAEYAYLYPPGSPLLVPGERITKEVVELLQWYDRSSFSIEGLRDKKHILAGMV